MASAKRQKAKQQQFDKVREKIDAQFQEGQYYEAQQLYQTLVRRQIDQESHDGAAALAQEGASKLLEYKQGNAGGELCGMLIECWKTAKAKLQPEHITTIIQLFSLFPSDSKEARLSFMKAAINWSTQAGSNPHGEPALHCEMARFYRSIADYSNAHKHYVRSRQPEEHGAALIEWSKKGFKSERDLFLARTVLQYLCLESIKGANVVCTVYKKEYNDGSLDTPLMNFIDFLLKTVERQAGPLFEMLKQKYAPSLQRDPSLNGYLDQIGEVYFGIKAPKGMLDSLLGGLGKAF